MSPSDWRNSSGGADSVIEITDKWNQMKISMGFFEAGVKDKQIRK
jgi:hypothetical protein